MDMQVTNISATNMSFDGFPNRAVFRYVNKLEKEEIKRVKREAKFEGKTATQEQLNQVYNLAENIRFKLTEYTSKLHPKTKLAYWKTKSQHKFILSNPITTGKLNYAEYAFVEGENDTRIAIQNFKIMPPSLGWGTIKNESYYNDIHQLNEWVKNMESIEPREINKWFLDTALIGLKNKAESARGNIFKKLYVRYLVNKIAKYNEEALVDVNISKDSLKEDVQRVYLGCEPKFLQA